MAAPRIARIETSKLREDAYEALRDAFTRGEFAPGDTVSLRSLADQLGVSMTPVREAVRRLVAEGALIDTPSRTLVVPPFDAQRMRDLKAARLALETLVLEQAMERIDAAGIDELETIIAGERNPEERGPDLAQNFTFHFTLYRHSGSEVLLPLVQGLWLQYGSYLNLVIQREEAVRLDEHKHHFEIIEAMRRGDLETACKALKVDIERSFRVLMPESK